MNVWGMSVVHGPSTCDANLVARASQCAQFRADQEYLQRSASCKLSPSTVLRMADEEVAVLAAATPSTLEDV